MAANSRPDSPEAATMWAGYQVRVTVDATSPLSSRQVGAAFERATAVFELGASEVQLRPKKIFLTGPVILVGGIRYYPPYFLPLHRNFRSSPLLSS